MKKRVTESNNSREKIQTFPGSSCFVMVSATLLKAMQLINPAEAVRKKAENGKGKCKNRARPKSNLTHR